MLTHSGQFVTIEHGAPTLEDIAVQLGRIPRFMGALKVFWPVLAHSVLVARLCPSEAKLYGLLHDAAEVVVGDVPRTIKTTEQKIKERQVLGRIYERLGIPWPPLEIMNTVKEADDRALKAEAWMLGSDSLLYHREFHPRDMDAEEMLRVLLIRYPDYEDYICPDGAMVQDFIRFARRFMEVVF